MKITTQHLRFYQAKKTPVPGWITKIAKTPWSLVEPGAVSVHELINLQEKAPRYSDAHSLMHLVKLVQGHKQETVKEFLYRLATRPCATDPKRRTSDARKWYGKLTRSEHELA